MACLRMVVVSEARARANKKAAAGLAQRRLYSVTCDHQKGPIVRLPTATVPDNRSARDPPPLALLRRFWLPSSFQAKTTTDLGSRTTEPCSGKNVQKSTFARFLGLFDTDATGQATFYRCFQDWVRGSERDCHIDLPNAASFSRAKFCDRCVYRKLKHGRRGDEVRPAWHVN